MPAVNIRRGSLENQLIGPKYTGLILCFVMVLSPVGDATVGEKQQQLIRRKINEFSPIRTGFLPTMQAIGEVQAHDNINYRVDPPVRSVQSNAPRANLGPKTRLSYNCEAFPVLRCVVGNTNMAPSSHSTFNPGDAILFKLAGVSPA
ncbi:hypothetical protein B0H13DRAFT_1899826 [Mycena leptocephala]|nr:hypothetical protein B0H13DRAFT_1899826 [Mycena leptocephala]